MYILKYLEQVHMARMHELASASPHMNEFRIFKDIHSITILLYTLKIVIFSIDNASI